jgi:hypothetical protein
MNPTHSNEGDASAAAANDLNEHRGERYERSEYPFAGQPPAILLIVFGV